MAALALAARREGACVLGSDREEGESVRLLRREGCRIHIGHDPSHVSPTLDAVIYSLAIDPSCPELCAARSFGVPCLSRPQYLGEYMRRVGERIGISGTHGKSTVTAMLRHILREAGERPTVLCGAPPLRPEELDPHADCLVYEGCEYRGALLSFCPTTLVLLNAEWDHPDCFPTEEALLDCFRRAAQGAQQLIVPAEDAPLRRALAGVAVPTVRFGGTEAAQVRYRVLSCTAGCYTFSLHMGDAQLGTVHLGVAGAFQIKNATAAITAAILHGIPPAVACHAMQTYTGIDRRMQRILSKNGNFFYYDYAHHPTAIREAIRTLREISNETLTVVFRPHTFSRTAALWEDFVAALAMADQVLLTDIYAAREEPMEGICAERLAAAIGARARYVPLEELPCEVCACAGTLALLGAGDLQATVDALRA